jgi:hypothetical protein
MDMPVVTGGDYRRILMNARSVLRGTVDTSAPADATPFRSRLRATWVNGSMSPNRHPAADPTIVDLVEVTAPFRWAA